MPFALPRRGLIEKTVARLGLHAQPLLRDERVVGVVAVVHEALAVPGRFREVGRVEKCGGFVEVAESVERLAGVDERLERRERLRAGERAERLVERGRLDEHELRAGRQVVGESGGGGRQLHARRRGERDARHALAGALRDRIEGADVLDLVAEEVEPVGLARGDRIDVDDAAAHGVVAGRFADGLRVVVEGLEPLQQLGKRLRAAARQHELT